jgi:hypothetical protein
MKEEKNKITRRSFVGTTGAAIAGLTILPSNVISGLGYKAPSDSLISPELALAAWVMTT